MRLLRSASGADDRPVLLPAPPGRRDAGADVADRRPLTGNGRRRQRRRVQRTGGGIAGNGSAFLLYYSSSILLLLFATLPSLNVAIAPKYETAYACEGKTLMIECENGDLINLIRANYGRFSITICNDHGNVDWSVNCMSPKSLRVLHSKCAQKQNCSVLASTSMFGDPCPGTHKYLEAHYQCVSAAQSSTTTNRPSPPWLKTSQPIVWSTSTVRNPVLSRINITDPLGVATTVTAAVTGVTGAGAAVRPTTPYKTLMVNQQSSPSFRNKGFENKSVNDDLAIIKTISDRKKATGGGDGGAASSAAARTPVDDEDFGMDEDEEFFPTQTAVLAGDSAHKKDNHGESNVLGGVAVDGSSKDRNDNQQNPPTQRQNAGGSVSVSGNSDGSGSSSSNSNVNNNVVDVSHACGPTSARNLFWNITRVGEINVQPCPGGATGIAKWRCVAIASLTPEQRVHLQQEQQQQQQSTLDDNNKSDISFNSIVLSGKSAGATWYSYQPDLTQCRSLWLNNLEIRVQQPDSSLISIANDLSQVTSSKTLYGGDMLVATKIIQTMSQKMHYDIETIPDQRQREALVYELLNSVVKTGSNLLDQSQHASWLDLSVEDQMRVATSLLTGLEDNAFLLADTILRERHVVQKVKNILLSIRVLETRNFVKNEVFPDSSMERWQVSNDQIELPKAALIENSEGGLVRIVFVAFDRLEQILRPQFSNIQQHQQQQQQHQQQQQQQQQNTRADQHKSERDSGAASSGNAGASRTEEDDGKQPAPRQRLLNSKVISASLGKGRHIQLSQPIRMVLKHLKTKNVSNPACVFWNYIDHAWSEDGCYVEHTNLTHTVCMCNHLTNFALLVDSIDETQLSLLSIIDDDIKTLIYISIAICIVIVVIALFALKFFHGVFAKVRNGGNSGVAGGMVGGTVGGGVGGGGRQLHHHSNNAGADLHHPNHHLHHHHHPTLAGAHLAEELNVNIQQQYNATAAGLADAHLLRGNHHNNININNNTGHNHHHHNNHNNNLVTTTFNNLGGGVGLGGASPPPPHGGGGPLLAGPGGGIGMVGLGGGSNYDTTSHRLTAAERINNNVNATNNHPLTYRPNNQINLLRSANQQPQQQQAVLGGGGGIGGGVGGIQSTSSTSIIASTSLMTLAGPPSTAKGVIGGGGGGSGSGSSSDSTGTVSSTAAEMVAYNLTEAGTVATSTSSSSAAAISASSIPLLHHHHHHHLHHHLHQHHHQHGGTGATGTSPAAAKRRNQ